MQMFALLPAATGNVKTSLQKQNFAQIIRYSCTLKAYKKTLKIFFATSSNRPILAVTMAVSQGAIKIEATSIAINGIWYISFD